MYEITERLTHTQLIKGLLELKEKYAGQAYKHKDGDVYWVVNSTVVNGEGGSKWGLIYSPLDELGVYVIHEIQHTRSLEEFLDGRFTRIQ